MSVDLGQNFLTDREVLGDIIKAADLQPSDVVLEIGPGKGILTEELAKKAKKVIAVELDRTLVPVLQKKFNGVKNVTIVHEDILRWWGTSQNQKITKSWNHFKVVANIPYRITAPILRMFLEGAPHPAVMVLMVQKEVAERVCATPGQMSMLSVSVQYYAKPEIVRIVPRTAFDPSPNVDSAVLKIIPFEEKHPDEVFEKNFFQLVKLGFSSRRKQLQGLLASGLHIPSVEAKFALEAIGCAPTVRAQELSLEVWVALTKHFFPV